MRNRLVLGITLALVASSMTLAPVSAATSTGTTRQATCTEGDLVALGQELPLAYRMYQTGQGGMQTVPLVVDGVMYISAGDGIAAALDPRTGRLIVMSALDNIVKGASGQAVQSMNILCGFAETAGLV